MTDNQRAKNCLDYSGIYLDPHREDGYADCLAVRRRFDSGPPRSNLEEA